MCPCESKCPSRSNSFLLSADDEPPLPLKLDRAALALAEFSNDAAEPPDPPIFPNKDDADELLRRLPNEPDRAKAEAKAELEPPAPA